MSVPMGWGNPFTIAGCPSRNACTTTGPGPLKADGGTLDPVERPEDLGG